jgi:hypothetical protein
VKLWAFHWLSFVIFGLIALGFLAHWLIKHR